VARLGIDASDLHLRGGQRGPGPVELLAKAHLGRAERAQLLSELTGTGRTGIDAGTERGFEASGSRLGRTDRVSELRRQLDEPRMNPRVEPRSPKPGRPPEGRLGDARPFGRRARNARRLDDT